MKPGAGVNQGRVPTLEHVGRVVKGSPQCVESIPCTEQKKQSQNDGNRKDGEGRRALHRFETICFVKRRKKKKGNLPSTLAIRGPKKAESRTPTNHRAIERETDGVQEDVRRQLREQFIGP